MCEPLMIEYARAIPTASAVRHHNIERLPAARLEMELVRAYGHLFNSARTWFVSVPPVRQLQTLHRVLGFRADMHMEAIVQLGRGIEYLETVWQAEAA